MFGRSKKISFFSNISTFSLTYILLIVYSIVCFCYGKWLYGIMGIATFVIIRIFTGKLHVKDGDVIFVFGLPGSGKTMFLSKIADDI